MLPTKSIKDQNPLNTCGWNSATVSKEPDENSVLSVRSLVAYAKANGMLSGDGFSNLRDNQKSIQNFGIAEESVVPDVSHNDWNTYSNINLGSFKDNASKHKSKTYWQVTTRNDSLKMLDDGRIISTGLDWYTGFNQGGGFKYPWIISKAIGYKVGGHAVAIIGYDLNYNGQKVYIMQNSYGSAWGDSGKFYITMDYLDNVNYGRYVHLDLEQPVVDILTQYFAQNVKGDKLPGIYYIYGGAKHAYPDEDTWMSFDAEKDGFTVVAQADLDKVPEGDPMHKEVGQNWGVIQKIKTPHWWQNIFINKR